MLPAMYRRQNPKHQKTEDVATPVMFAGAPTVHGTVVGPMEWLWLIWPPKAKEAILSDECQILERAGRVNFLSFLEELITYV